MLYRAVEPFIGRHRITVGILQEHNEKYNVVESIKKEFNEQIDIVIIPVLTSGPAETVFTILCNANIDLNNEIFVKDCDSYFNHDKSYGNYICVSNIENYNTINKIHNKSFIIKSDQGIVTKIVEKQVVSNMFCVGGYKFSLGYDFKKAYEEIRFGNNQEVFISHVIQQLMLTGHVFQIKEVVDYADVGTLDDWVQYNQPHGFQF
jgi:hypothetical protein